MQNENSSLLSPNSARFSLQIRLELHPACGGCERRNHCCNWPVAVLEERQLFATCEKDCIRISRSMGRSGNQSGRRDPSNWFASRSEVGSRSGPGGNLRQRFALNMNTLLSIFIFLAGMGAAGGLFLLFIDRYHSRRWFRCTSCKAYWTLSGDRVLTVDDQKAEAAIQVRCDECREKEEKQ